ncbi:MAG TPA: LuxR C-terminal-related transcriptional regulator, partial [Candidatus Sulfomarinibacteraceae bacterium]|nr:LuxR C-terminal-related transcriptional regulator [Candidatus Sulfomarinibacteraceae bacterium]
ELYDAYGQAASAVEHIRETEEATRLARERYLAAGRPVDAARMLLWLASVSGREADPVTRRLELVDQALLEIGRLPASAARESLERELLSVRASWRLDASRIDDGVADAAQARRLAEAADDRELALDATVTQARIDIATGQVDAGLARGLRAARDARDAGFESVGVTAFRNLAAWAARVLDHGTAEAAIREGIRYADAIEQSHCRQQMATTSALLAWAAGRWEDADEIARQELVERGCRRGMLGAMDVLGFVAMGRGRVGDAHRWLDESLEGGRRTNEIQMILPPAWGLAELDLVAGLPDRAAARCMEVLELAVDAGERSLLLPYVVTGTRAWLAARQPDQADRWLDRTTAHLAGWERVAGPAIAHATGLLRLSTGTVGAAREALETAATGWDGRGRTWEALWARLDLAHCLMRSNRFGEAASLLAIVRSRAEAMASLPLLARVTELARIGRGRGAPEEPWRPLTIREFEVARLIAQGMTNSEIADELRIAPKTASAHVEHILAKLGAARRAEIATWVASVTAPTDGPRGSRATVAVTR